MKKLTLLLALVVSSPAWATITFGHNTTGSTSIAVAGTALTITSVPAGNLIMGTIAWSTSGRTLSSCTATSSTCVVDTGCHNTLAAAGATDCFYILSTGATLTSVTLLASVQTTGAWYISDYSTTAAPFVLDTECNSLPASSTAPVGCTLTLTGTNDVILAGIACAQTCSGTPTGWTHAVSTNGDNQADKINTNSGTGPTWTQAPAGTSIVFEIAIKETSGGGGVVRRRAWVIQSP